MLRLTAADDFDERIMTDCYVDPRGIYLIQACHVGYRSTGSKITLKNGESFKVWESTETVSKRVFDATEEPA